MELSELIAWVHWICTFFAISEVIFSALSMMYIAQLFHNPNKEKIVFSCSQAIVYTGIDINKKLLCLTVFTILNIGLEMWGFMHILTFTIIF